MDEAIKKLSLPLLPSKLEELWIACKPATDGTVAHAELVMVNSRLPPTAYLPSWQCLSSPLQTPFPPSCRLPSLPSSPLCTTILSRPPPPISPPLPSFQHYNPLPSHPLPSPPLSPIPSPRLSPLPYSPHAPLVLWLGVGEQLLPQARATCAPQSDSGASPWAGATMLGGGVEWDEGRGVEGSRWECGGGGAGADEVWRGDAGGG